MKWLHKSVQKGDTRIKTFFAWLPVTSQAGETRWLEQVTVLQRYFTGMGGATEPRIFAYWQTIDFVESA